MNDLHFIDPERTKAILIGVSEFKDRSFINAKPIKNNVTKLDQLLQDNEILGLPDDRILILKNNETNDDILDKIEVFIDDDNFADTVIFYFAGHGYRTDKGDFYLVTNNTKKRRIHLTSIPWEEITATLEKGGGIQQRLYILDACHSGAATLGDDYEDTQIPDGSALIAAAKADDKAYFDANNDYTYFTEALIDVLENGLNKDDQKELDINSLYTGLDNRLKNNNFNISKKTTDKINNVIFFKNKKYDKLSIQRKAIKDLIKKADRAKNKGNFEEAKRSYALAIAETKLNSELNDIEQNVTKKLQELKNIQSYHKIYENHYKDKINRFNSTIKQLEQEKQQLENENKANKQKVTDLNKEIGELKQNLKQSTEFYNKLLAQKQEIEADNAKKDKKIEDLNGQIAKLKQEFKDFKDKGENIYGKLLIEKQKLETENAKKTTNIKNLSKKIAQFETENNRLKQELEKLQTPPKPNSQIQKKNNFTEKIGNINFDMIFVEGGTFLMGSPDDDKKACDSEKPQYKVSLSDYYIGKNAVTFAEYDAFCTATNRKKPYDGGWGRANRPVINVSWDDAIAYCEWLSQETGKNYCLPTEAEWEFAARGGNNSKGYKYSGSNNISKVAWYSSNSDGKTHLVGSLQANELGIYDMSGNVWEWCNDWYDKNYYKNSPSDNPQGAASGSDRVFRGGSWYAEASGCRVADRNDFTPSHGYDDVGFRVAFR